MTYPALLISQAAHQTPSADNSQPWKLEWQENTLIASYDQNRAGLCTFPADSHAMLLTMGALSENLTQAASGLNVDVDFDWNPAFNYSNPVYFQARISSSEFVNPTKFKELPLFKRQTNRHAYQSKPLSSDALEVIKNLKQDDLRILVIEENAQIKLIAHLVRSASEVRFQIREVHEWLAKSFRFATKPEDPHGEGLDINTIDLPPGGGLFLRLISNWQRMRWLNKLGMYKVMAMIDSHPVSKAPALIAIIGPDSYKDTLTAGQLMNRAWIALNEQGIAVHPYYVIPDQLQRKKENKIPEHLINQVNKISEQTVELFGLREGEILHMLFRTGYPSLKPVKSKRLPLSSVCSGIKIEEF